MTQWLQSPGAMHNNLVRFQKLWSELNSKYNQAGHTYYILLLEPEKIGKDKKQPNNYGRLWCKACLDAATEQPHH